MERTAKARRVDDLATAHVPQAVRALFLVNDMSLTLMTSSWPRSASATPNGIDALLDNVSYAPGAYDAALKDGGRVASPNNAAGEGPGRTNLMAAPTRENLERLARLLDAGAVTVSIHQTYPLEQVAAAMNTLATAHTRGKLALQIA